MLLDQHKHTAACFVAPETTSLNLDIGVPAAKFFWYFLYLFLTLLVGLPLPSLAVACIISLLLPPYMIGSRTGQSMLDRPPTQ